LRFGIICLRGRGRTKNDDAKREDRWKEASGLWMILRHRWISSHSGPASLEGLGDGGGNDDLARRRKQYGLRLTLGDGGEHCLRIGQRAQALRAPEDGRCL
jgi:hypothetical protein